MAPRPSRCRCRARPVLPDRREDGGAEGRYAALREAVLDPPFVLGRSAPGARHRRRAGYRAAAGHGVRPSPRRGGDLRRARSRPAARERRLRRRHLRSDDAAGLGDRRLRRCRGRAARPGAPLRLHQRRRLHRPLPRVPRPDPERARRQAVHDRPARGGDARARRGRARPARVVPRGPLRQACALRRECRSSRARAFAAVSCARRRRDVQFLHGSERLARASTGRCSRHE